MADLTTLASVKTHLNITGSGDDAVLAQLVTQISEYINGLIGRDITEQAIVNELHDGGELDIFLNQYPIDLGQTFTAEARSGSLSAPTWVPYTDNDFIVYPDRGFVHFLATTPRGHLNLRFTYTGGYTTIPSDLELLANQIIGLAFNRRISEGIKSEQVEGSSITYSDGTSSGGLSTLLKQEHHDIINRYREVAVGENI